MWFENCYSLNIFTLLSYVIWFDFSLGMKTQNSIPTKKMMAKSILQEKHSSVSLNSNNSCSYNTLYKMFYYNK